MKKRVRKLSLAKETIGRLNALALERVVGGIRLQPSSGTEWTDQSVCPSQCYSDCSYCTDYTFLRCPV
jgi:hypothetical protein